MAVRADRQKATPLRVAVIGAGRMVRWHVRAARRAGAELAAIVDLDENRAREAAASLGITVAARRLSTIVEAGRLDAVHIATPASAHSALVREAIAAGLHVLVEKPLAETAKETEALVQLAEHARVVLCPVHQLPFQDGALKAAAGIAIIGKPAAIAMRLFSAGGTGLDRSAMDWVVGEILPHPLSVLCAFWPDAPLDAHWWSVYSPAPGELMFAGEHAGALLSITISLSGRPPRLDMTIAGARGSIDIDFFHGYRVFSVGRVSRMQKTLQPFATASAHLMLAGLNLAGRALRGETAYPGLDRLVERFYAAVCGMAGSPIAAAETVAIAAARDSMLMRLAQLRAGQLPAAVAIAESRTRDAVP